MTPHDEPTALAPDHFGQARERMVETQIISRGVTDPLVVHAMRTVPRHLFVPSERRRNAHTDGALPIGYGQTISQPYMVAMMTELALRGTPGAKHPPTERRWGTVLEVGGGSGYQAAILGQIAQQVITIERVPELAARARRTLAQLQYDNVEVIEADGSRGLPDRGPFDAIVVAAAAPAVPDQLRSQLTLGAHLVIPVGTRMRQDLRVVTKTMAGWHDEAGTSCVFVPLIGEQGWKE
jgi:protein-L-isoaspartate(D-aspartate) O-methyltransferase